MELHHELKTAQMALEHAGEGDHARTVAEARRLLWELTHLGPEKDAEVVAPSRGQGLKDDGGKDPWDLLPWGALRHVVRVLEHGRRKYAAHNWQKVAEPRRRYFAALMRHLVEWEEKGGMCADGPGAHMPARPITDPETHLPTLAHAACCVLFLLWFDLRD